MPSQLDVICESITKLFGPRSAFIELGDEKGLTAPLAVIFNDFLSSVLVKCYHQLPLGNSFPRHNGMFIRQFMGTNVI